MAEVVERARNYVAKMPPAVSGSGGHDATFEVACVLLRGFSLSWEQASAVMAEYSARCAPPWSQYEIEHKLRQAANSKRPDGYLLGDGSRGQVSHYVPPVVRRQRVTYSPEVLRQAAGELRGVVDAVWLANRSEVDPATVDSAGFLRRVFRSGERVVLFSEDKSQGQAVWPLESVPQAGERGMWYLIQPVTGEYAENPRTGKPSRRSEESVTEWRYMLLESDEAPAAEWLAALAKFPGGIAAIYSSGGRSVHALLKVDCSTKAEWDAKRAALLRTRIGRFAVDEKAITGVRLSRLPQQPRPEKNGFQKLLYVQGFPTKDRLVDLSPRRDVEEEWWQRGQAAYWSGDRRRIAEALVGMEYYARVRPRLADGAREMREALAKIDRRELVQ